MDKNGKGPLAAKAPEEKHREERPPEKDAAGGIDRRRFLETLAFGGALLAGAGASGASEEFSGWPNSFGLLTDLTLCVGCRSCEKACNESNGLPQPDKPFDDASVFEQKRRPDAHSYTVVNRYENPKDPGMPVYRKVQCNHCKEPACFSACPVHAYSKMPEGAVKYNPDLCFGCRYCMIACPFYVPAYDYESALDPKIVKCTMCYDTRLKHGKMTACAEACPTGALTFGKRNDLITVARERIAKQPDKYIDHIYGEHEAGGTNWLYISGVPFEQLDFPTNLPDRPMIEGTKGFLSSVPLVFTIWPALFGMMYSAVRHRDRIHEETTSGTKEESHE